MIDLAFPGGVGGGDFYKMGCARLCSSLSKPSLSLFLIFLSSLPFLFIACGKDGVTHQVDCDSCNDVCVWGNCGQRAPQRESACRLIKKADDSVMWNHVQSKHDASADPPPVFSMKVTGVFRNDLLSKLLKALVSTRWAGHVWNHQSSQMTDDASSSDSTGRGCAEKPLLHPLFSPLSGGASLFKMVS